MSKRKPFVGVIGGGDVDDHVRAVARELGSELGRRGLSLVCGGLGGVMEAVCEGLRRAREEHGTHGLAMGILPGPFAADANPYVDVVVPTGMGIARNILVVRSADVIIVVDGGSGTLSELAFAWQLGKPIVALTSAGGIAAEVAGRRLDDRRQDPVLTAGSPVEAVELALRAMRQGSP
jgi:uncharacterized protein (TIGR00725 family)